jgi:hypothetical protein
MYSNLPAEAEAAERRSTKNLKSAIFIRTDFPKPSSGIVGVMNSKFSKFVWMRRPGQAY